MTHQQEAAVASMHVSIGSGEKFLVNGAVVTVGDGSLEIQNHDVVLLGRDVMLPEDATSPAKRIYYWLMLMFIDAPGQDAYRLRLLDDMNDLLNATSLVDVAKSLGLINRFVQREDYQRAMATAQALIAFESELLAMQPRQAA
jgi:flagellar protein FlbT